MHLGSLTLDEFLDRLGSAEPVPGGGSLAALAGAQAAAMLAMCCNLTIGRPRFAEVESEVRKVLASALTSQHALMQLADRDVAAYLGVRDAYQLPRKTEDERTARADAIETAMHLATEVPVEASEAARTVLDLALRAARSTNPSALGDVSVSGYLAMAAVRGAADQAHLNLTTLTDQPFVSAMASRIDKALEQVDGAVAAVTATVFERWGNR